MAIGQQLDSNWTNDFVQKSDQCITANILMGDTIEILQKGTLCGKQAKVEPIGPDGTVTVRSDRWVMSRTYPLELVKLVRRGRQADAHE
ncbi:MAG: hypothetical protein HC769_31600 [Cyanobacteria bacterium CRU_2_1]|nr:hypothetical protein [Cyanobacteria bacterium CRU_2_1]